MEEGRPKEAIVKIHRQQPCRGGYVFEKDGSRVYEMDVASLYGVPEGGEVAHAVGIPIMVYTAAETTSGKQ